MLSELSFCLLAPLGLQGTKRTRLLPFEIRGALSIKRFVQHSVLCSDVVFGVLFGLDVVFGVLFGLDVVFSVRCSGLNVCYVRKGCSG